MKLFAEELGIGGRISPAATVSDRVDAVAGDAAAVEPAGLAEVRSSAVSGVKALWIDGVAPEAANLSSGRYPLVRPLSVVTLGAPAGAARAFVDELLSDAGQAAVNANYAGVR